MRLKTGYTHIVVLLDRSGSMGNKVAESQGGFNRLMRDQRAVPGKATVTLIQFDDQYEVVYQARDIQEVPPLVMEPRGYTAYLDALGRAIITTGEWLHVMAEADRPEHVIFVTITDGLENASKEYTKARIKALVEQQTNTYKWEFVFLGANMDATAEAGEMGIRRATAASFDMAKMDSAFHVVSTNMAGMRRGVRASMDFSDEDRKRLNRPRQPKA